MSGLLEPYVITQETEWAGRRFCMVRDRRTDHVVYLMGEPLGVLGGSHAHPNLPVLKEVGVEGQVRWWEGYLPEGENLEDLRRTGQLTESELLGALISVVDALQALSAMVPPPVPAYIDPACIIRDRMGRWVLDYLALAQAPEAHANNLAPPGVHPFGVLLYWVVTGETVRRSRVQVSRLDSAATPGLQLIVIRCLGRSYPSLAELRADLSRAGKDREFGPLILRIRSKAQAARAEALSNTLRAPHIPINDRPWAAPPPPRGGYTGASLPLQYRRVRPSRGRWVPVVLVGLLAVTMGAAAAVQLGLVPSRYLPAWMRPLPTVTLFPKPEPMHVDVSTAQMEGRPVLVYLDGQSLGEATIYASPNYPYIALPDLNRLFRRQFTWAANSSGQGALQDRDRTLPIAVFEQVGDTLWVKMVPSVQQWMGLRFQSYRSGTIHFSTKG
jgi:hypothetical protein